MIFVLFIVANLLITSEPYITKYSIPAKVHDESFGFLNHLNKLPFFHFLSVPVHNNSSVAFLPSNKGRYENTDGKLVHSGDCDAFLMS